MVPLMGGSFSSSLLVGSVCGGDASWASVLVGSSVEALRGVSSAGVSCFSHISEVDGLASGGDVSSAAVVVEARLSDVVLESPRAVWVGDLDPLIIAIISK